MTYTAPAQQVVFESDPKIGQALLTSWPEYHPVPWQSVKPYGSLPISSLAVFHRAEALDILGLKDFAGAAYVHMMRSPSGHERLVVVWIGYGARTFPAPANRWSRDRDAGRSPDYGIALSAYIFAPASWKLGSRLSKTKPYWVNAFISRQLPLTSRLTLFAGQADPADPSHFTIAYNLDGQPGRIDGRLQDDDEVDVRVTAGPLKVWGQE